MARVERQQIDLDRQELEDLVTEALRARGYRNFGPISFPTHEHFGLQGMMVEADIDVPTDQQELDNQTRTLLLLRRQASGVRYPGDPPFRK